MTATASFDATTSWTRAAHNFGQQMFNVLGKHTPELSWTLDPVADPTLLEGAWYACHWAIFGPLPEGSRGYELLRKPKYSDIVGCEVTERTYHLWAFDDQHQIPYGWLGVGPHRCVPHGACYTAHCGDTYVWVMPDQLYHLSEFTLVLLDIATTAQPWYARNKSNKRRPPLTWDCQVRPIPRRARLPRRGRRAKSRCPMAPRKLLLRRLPSLSTPASSRNRHYHSS